MRLSASLGFMALLLAAGCERPAVVPDSAIAALVSDLRSQVRTLSREVTVFHYTEREHIGGTDTVIDPFDPRRVGFIEFQTRSFEDDDPNCSGGNGCIMGKGLYTAIDPVSSYGYGGGGLSWSMLKIALSPGARVLNVGSASLSQRISALLGDWGCGGLSAWDTTMDHFFKGGQDVFCHGILKRVVHALQIDALSYEWAQPPVTSLCAQPQRDVAFLLISSAHVAWERTEVFTATVPSPDPAAADRALVERVYDGMQPESRLWPALTLAADEAQAQAWARQSLFSCGNYPEDGP